MYFYKKLCLMLRLDFCVSDRSICVSFKRLFYRTDTCKPVLFTSLLINTVHHSCCIQCIGQCVLRQTVGLLVNVQVLNRIAIEFDATLLTSQMLSFCCIAVRFLCILMFQLLVGRYLAARCYVSSIMIEIFYGIVL